jgi:membrane protein YdbS with pleckstrin-like domain
MPPDITPNQTYISKDGRQLGPFDDSFILTALGNGTFDYADSCWREGWEDWKTLESFYPRPKSPVAVPPATPAIPPKPEEILVWEGRASMLNFASLWVLVALSIWFLVGFVFLGMIFWRYYSRKYTITTRRVMLETGIFVKSSNQLRIGDIRSINVTKAGLAGFLFGIGTVELSSAATDDAEVVFEGIRDADTIRDTVSGLQGH